MRLTEPVHVESTYQDDGRQDEDPGGPPCEHDGGE
jgi:hypothetical protein